MATSKHGLQLLYAGLTVGLPTLGVIVALVRAFEEGVQPLEWSLFVGMYVLTGLGIEAGFHRFFSHRSFRAGSVITRLLGILGSMAGQGPVLFWAAIHRRHHAKTDRLGDPHSPWEFGRGPLNLVRGLFHAQFGWLFRVDESDWPKLTPDLLRDRVVVDIHATYPVWVFAGIAVPAMVGWLFAGVDGALRGALWGGLVRMFALSQVTWAVNSIGHVLGARPNRTRDKSGNLVVLALPSLGGSWHNNHHAHPSSARLDFRHHQLDISGLFIELLAKLRLATDVRRTSHFAGRRSW